MTWDSGGDSRDGRKTDRYEQRVLCVRTDLQQQLSGVVEIAVVADAVHRAGRGDHRQLRRPGRGHHIGGGRRTPGARRRAGAATEPAAPAAPATPAAPSPAAHAPADDRAGGQRGQAAPPALLPGSRMGLGGGHVRLHGALTQPRHAVVLRDAREPRGPQVPGRHLRRHRSVSLLTRFGRQSPFG